MRFHKGQSVYKSFEISANRVRSGKAALLLSVGAAALLGWMGAARAADADGTSGTNGTSSAADGSYDVAYNGQAGGIEQVTVTARFRKENQQDVPIALTALGGAQLDQLGTTQIQQLQFLAPNLEINVPNPRQTSFSIRGIGNNPAADGLSQSVGLYIDGVYLDRPGMAAFDLLDVAQIEVLRGPQGTLFGRNTTGGALSVTTAIPTFDFTAKAEASAGDYELQQYQATVSGPIADDLAFRVSGYDTFRGGYVKDAYTGGADEGLDRQGLRAQLLYQPTGALSWRLIFEAGHEDDTAGGAVLYSKGPSASANPKFVSYDQWAANLGITPVFDPNGLENDQNEQQRLIERQYAGTSILDWTVDGYTLTSITGYRHWSFRPQNDFDWTYADVIRNNGAADFEQQVSQELRLASPSGGEFDYVAGLYYLARYLDNHSYTDYGSQYAQGLGALGNPALDDGQTNTYGRISTFNYAAYAQGTWHIDPLWDLTVGGRETYELTQGSVERTAFAGGTGKPPVSVAPFSGAIKVGKATPSGLLTLSYKPVENYLLYATASYGAKAGGFNSPTVPQANTGAFLPMSTLVVKPEKAVNFEIGTKTSWFDDRLTANVDLYWTDIYGYQANTVHNLGSGGLQSVITNVGSVRSRGAEAELTARPLEGLELNASVGFTDAFYHSFTNAPAVQGSTATTQNLTGRPVLQAPRWTLSAGATYTTHLTDSIDGYLGADVGYKSSYFGYIDDSPYSLIKGFAVVNGRVGTVFADGHYDLSAWIRNAADVHYVNLLYPAATGSGGYFGWPAEPRTFGVTLKANW
jgi:iron complex outermembrane receptor protein